MRSCSGNFAAAALTRPGVSPKLWSVLPGEIFGGYRIEGKLGAGGMGTVYLARHPRLPREDALKVLPPAASADQEFRARFLREAELAARLRHPNIVAIHDRGMDDGCLWIAMQYVQGCDASDLIARDPAGLPPWRAVHIIEEAARGLDAAHAAGLLHRDVKPANILIAVNPDGSYRVLVTDFGIARAVGESTVLTAAGEVLATVSYAAPEQISAAPVDHRVDVYALGCTLHQLLTGSLPFPRPTPAAVMYAHLCEPPPRPRSSIPLFPHNSTTSSPVRWRRIRPIGIRAVVRSLWPPQRRCERSPRR